MCRGSTDLGVSRFCTCGIQFEVDDSVVCQGFRGYTFDNSIQAQHAKRREKRRGATEMVENSLDVHVLMVEDLSLLIRGITGPGAWRATSSYPFPRSFNGKDCEFVLSMLAKSNQVRNEERDANMSLQLRHT